MPRTVIGIDTETDRIEGQNVAPEMICISAVSGDDTDLIAHCEKDRLKELLDVLLYGGPDVHLVGMFVAFDWAVLLRTYPEHTEALWQLLEDERLHDIALREMLLNLTSHGGIEFMPLPNGETAKVTYNLAALVKHHFGLDIAADKDEEDAWRKNYRELRGMKAEEYPEEAQQYAIDDAGYAERIYWRQEELREEMIEETGIDPFKVECFRVACSCALYLWTVWGVCVDADEWHRAKAWLNEELKPENVQLLVDAKILLPGQPPRPYKNGATHPDGTPKMTKEQPEKISHTTMREYILGMKERMPDEVEIRRTNPSKKFPKGQISLDAEWLDDHYHLDPVIEQYRHRQQLQKLVTTELPRMCELDDDGERIEDRVAPVVHPGYEVLKRTGRTSSMGSNLYPSFNAQNVDPRVRPCYVPREGYVFFSIDYNQMELGTWAQRCLNLFGESVMADKINAGIDPHAYLGASIAYNADEAFQEECNKAGVEDTDDIYECFMPFKAHEDAELRKWFKHFRTLAKPTGLGYPGGLGASTFVAYAKATYGLVIDLETAKMLRDVWMQVYTEAAPYFEWINNECIDRINSPKTVKFIDEEGEEKTKEVTVYAYETPMGLYRAGCDYCAAANGAGLQAFAAEGALTAVFNGTRACYDPAMESILLDDAEGPVCRPICFIHDEILGELREDDLMHDRIEEMSRIMIESMRTVTPDVTPRVEPALMRRWDKRAEPVYDADGRLTIWTPDNED